MYIGTVAACSTAAALPSLRSLTIPFHAVNSNVANATEALQALSGLRTSPELLRMATRSCSVSQNFAEVEAHTRRHRCESSVRCVPGRNNCAASVSCVCVVLCRAATQLDRLYEALCHLNLYKLHIPSASVMPRRLLQTSVRNLIVRVYVCACY